MYNLVIMSIFSVLLFLTRYDHTQVIQNLRDLSVLKKINIISAISIAIAFLNFSGIPPLFGFFAKIYILSTSFSQSFYIINLALLTTSVLSVYYYIRILKTLFFTFQLKYAGTLSIPFFPSLTISLAILVNIAYLLISFVYVPSDLLELIQYILILDYHT